MPKLTDLLRDLTKRKKKDRNGEANQAPPPDPDRALPPGHRDSVVIATYNDTIASVGRSPVMSSPPASTLRPLRAGKSNPGLDESFRSRANAGLNNLSDEARAKLLRPAKSAAPAISDEESQLMLAQGMQASSRRPGAPRLRHAPSASSTNSLESETLAAREHHRAGTEAFRSVTPSRHADGGPYRHGEASKSAPNFARPLPAVPPLPNRSKSGDDQKAGAAIPPYFARQRELRDKRRAEQAAKLAALPRPPSPPTASINAPVSPSAPMSPASSVSSTHLSYAPYPANPPMSEKAQGKQRAISRSSSTSSLSSTKSRRTDKSGPSL